MVFTYKTIWCPYTLEYICCYVDMIELIAHMRIIFKIIEGILETINTFLKNVKHGSLIIRYSRLKKEDVRQV